jgi:iron complex outermembrane receptor protein
MRSRRYSNWKAETIIGKYDLGYVFDPKMSANLVLDYSRTKGFGKQIGENERSIGGASLLFKHQPLRWLGYEASVKRRLQTITKARCCLRWEHNSTCLKTIVCY